MSKMLQNIKFQEKIGKFREKIRKFQKKLEKFRKIQKNSEKFGNIRKNSDIFVKNPTKMLIFFKACYAIKKFGPYFLKENR